MTPSPWTLRRAALRRPVAALGLALTFGATAMPTGPSHVTPPAPAGLDSFASAVNQGYDNPRAALHKARASADAVSPDPTRRFWNQLAQSRLHVLLEQVPDAEQALRRAHEALAAWQGDARLPGLALALQELQVATLTQESQALRPRVVALRAQAQATGQPRLACDAVQLHAFVLGESADVDLAWKASKEAEACAQALGDLELQAGAILQMGMVASKAVARSDGGKAPALHYQNALQVLGQRPARYLRSIIEWELGKALNDNSPQERRHYESAREFSRQIGDAVGAAIADIDIGLVLLAQGRPQEALQGARRAREVLMHHGMKSRVMATYSVSIGALTQMESREVLREIDDARRWELPTHSLATRGYLARQMARGYAAVGEHRRAYEEQVRSEQLAAQARKDASNREVLQLQARYEAAQRDAENARLKLRDESARLQLESALARQQGLWAALAALATALLSTAWVAMRIWRQRRQMADLASRDELTGAPNRRAVMAIARSQWAHSRRLKLPLSVAMLDLDHFKRVNDTWGHDGGDRVLRAFAQAAAATLRAQDRIGRYGGEEWLLVAPGAGAGELQAIFRRLRERFAATPIDGLPQPHGLSFSMGGAPDHAEVSSVDELITEADARLYRAKTEGRDRACVTDRTAQGESSGHALHWPREETPPHEHEHHRAAVAGAAGGGAGRLGAAGPAADAQRALVGEKPRRPRAARREPAAEDPDPAVPEGATPGAD